MINSRQVALRRVEPMVANQSCVPRPGREALTEAERRLVVEEFHSGGSRTEIVNRILARLQQVGKAVSRRSVQRWVAKLDYINSHRLREPLTDEQWQQAEQAIGERHGITRRSLDSWIAAVTAWEQGRTASDVLWLRSIAAAQVPGSSQPKPRLAELFLAVASRDLVHDILEFMAYPRDEWEQRVKAFIRHLEASLPDFMDGTGADTGAGERHATPQSRSERRSDRSYQQVHRLTIRLVGNLRNHFFRENLKGEAAFISDLLDTVEPDQRGKPRWWGAAFLRNGFPRWAAFIAACRLVELAIRETLPPNPLWVELGKETTEVEGEWGLLQVHRWLGPCFNAPAITMDQVLEMRRWVWQHADRIWRGEVKLHEIDNVPAFVQELAEAWKSWWWEVA